MAKRRRKKQKNRKVARYRKPFNINLAVIILGFIFVYMFICVFLYATSKKTVGYEVRTGSLSANNVYRGIALRTEEIVPSEYNGYINYFSQQGVHLGAGDLAYTVDESGTLKDYLDSQSADEATLTQAQLSELKNDIISFSSGFHKENFSALYTFKNTFSENVQALAGSSVLSSLNDIASGSSGVSIHYGYASSPGILIYNTDGFETKTLETLTDEDFDEANYEENSLDNNNLVAAGDPAYKLCTSENWSVVIRTTAEKAQELADLEYVKVRFLQNQYESWGAVTTRDMGDDQAYVALSFTNSMVTYCGDRFLDIELITEEQKGLKVPNTAIVESDFFLVPKEFITTGTGGNRGVILQTYTENGQKNTEFIASSPYSETDTQYYLDETKLSVGDVIIKPDSEETFTISEQAPLVGVYNINKGYADFREVNVLYKNEEYSIVQPNTTYGLAEYDYIVLDASSISADELINQ